MFRGGIYTLCIAFNEEIIILKISKKSKNYSKIKKKMHTRFPNSAFPQSMKTSGILKIFLKLTQKFDF